MSGQEIDSFIARSFTIDLLDLRRGFWPDPEAFSGPVAHNVYFAMRVDILKDSELVRSFRCGIGGHRKYPRSSFSGSVGGQHSIGFDELILLIRHAVEAGGVTVRLSSDPTSAIRYLDFPRVWGSQGVIEIPYGTDGLPIPYEDRDLRFKPWKNEKRAAQPDGPSESQN
ncbi:MAG: hypothetical protein AAGI17_02670 [Planctomycetota bacterium]